MFDANLEAVTTTKLIMRDEKQRALRKLERRKTLRSNGGNDGDGPHAKQSRNKRGRGVKRDRSLTTQLTHKSFAEKEVWESHLTERRRSSLIRLQERIREKQQGKKGTEADNEKTVDKEEHFNLIEAIITTYLIISCNISTLQNTIR